MAAAAGASLRLFSFSLLLVLSCLLSFPWTPLAETDDQGFMSLSISQKGLDFIKDLLIQQAVSSLSSLSLHQIQKSFKIPVIGTVHASLTNITLSRVNVSSSVIHPGGSGVAIVASGGTVYLSTDWKYSYSTWLVPIDISDSGTADIRLMGCSGEVNEEQAEEMTTLLAHSYIPIINASLHALQQLFIQQISSLAVVSWRPRPSGISVVLESQLVDVFEDQIRSVIEKAINKKLKEGIVKLDTLLQKLPKEVKVDNITSLNATFVNDPLLSNSSVQFEINGLFTANGNVSSPKCYLKNSHSLGSCKGPPEMLWISLDEAVFNSASDVYFKNHFVEFHVFGIDNSSCGQAGIMRWIVDKVPDQSLLNTASWKFIVPQLYKKYPNDDMLLNISLSSSPAIWITQDHIDATVSADMVIEVIDGGRIIPVACISVAQHGVWLNWWSGSVAPDSSVHDMVFPELEIAWDHVDI
ncbi:hypothetical protein ACLOJK_000697 [Asimina triloba]